MNDPLDSSRASALANARLRRVWPPGWSEVAREGPRTITRVYSYVQPVPDTIWVIEHDPEQGVFRVRGPDGQTQTFRDQPTRYLKAVWDTETGEPEPRFIEGRDCQPMDLYLCPEVREGQ
jgi:hypothetical protein